MSQAQTIAPGAQILVRDAVWRVLQVNRTSNGKNSCSVGGVSETVYDLDAIFQEEHEPNIEVINATETVVEVLITSHGKRPACDWLAEAR